MVVPCQSQNVCILAGLKHGGMTPIPARCILSKLLATTAFTPWLSHILRLSCGHIGMPMFKMKAPMEVSNKRYRYQVRFHQINLHGYHARKCICNYQWRWSKIVSALSQWVNTAFKLSISKSTAAAIISWISNACSATITDKWKLCWFRYFCKPLLSRYLATIPDPWRKTCFYPWFNLRHACSS